MQNLEKYRTQLDALNKTADMMQLDLHGKRKDLDADIRKTLDDAKDVVLGKFDQNYHEWYTEALAVIKQLTPDRLQEFKAYYEVDSKRKEFSVLTYRIHDWLQGLRSPNTGFGVKKFEDLSTTTSQFDAQRKILKAAAKRFESSLFNLEQIVRADLFDSELDAATELLKHKFIRAAGAIAGVVLEKHLGVVCSNHQVTLTKKHPTISTFNDALKDSAVIDVATWRFIQHLGDIRNNCDHGNTVEPKSAEVTDLIAGVKKISKTIL